MPAQRVGRVSFFSRGSDVNTLCQRYARQSASLCYRMLRNSQHGSSSYIHLLSRSQRRWCKLSFPLFKQFPTFFFLLALPGVQLQTESKQIRNILHWWSSILSKRWIWIFRRDLFKGIEILSNDYLFWFTWFYYNELAFHVKRRTLASSGYELHCIIFYLSKQLNPFHIRSSFH